MADKLALTVTGTKLEEIQSGDMLSSPDGVKSDLGYIGQQVLLQRATPKHPVYNGASDEVGITLKRDVLRSANHSGVALKSNTEVDYSFQAISSKDTILGHLIRFFVDVVLVAIPNKLLAGDVTARELHLQGNPSVGTHSLGGNGSALISMKTEQSNANRDAFRMVVAPNTADSNNAAFAVESTDNAGGNAGSMMKFWHNGKIEFPPVPSGGGLFNCRQSFFYKGLYMVQDSGPWSVNFSPAITWAVSTTDPEPSTIPDKRAFRVRLDHSASPGESTLVFSSDDDKAAFNVSSGLRTDRFWIHHAGSVGVQLGIHIGAANPSVVGHPGPYRLQVESQIWATNATIMTASDKRLKSNIVPIAPALDVIDKLRPCTFDKETQDGKVFQLGFIAQEVEEAIKDQAWAKCVVHAPDNPEDMYNMSPGELVPILVKAIQELRAEIEELKRLPR